MHRILSGTARAYGSIIDSNMSGEGPSLPDLDAGPGPLGLPPLLKWSPSKSPLKKKQREAEPDAAATEELFGEGTWQSDYQLYLQYDISAQTPVTPAVKPGFFTGLLDDAMGSTQTAPNGTTVLPNSAMPKTAAPAAAPASRKAKAAAKSKDNGDDDFQTKLLDKIDSSAKTMTDTMTAMGREFILEQREGRKEMLAGLKDILQG